MKMTVWCLTAWREMLVAAKGHPIIFVLGYQQIFFFKVNILN